jgi:NADH/F420H2 dehydrogenase subunit C
MITENYFVVKDLKHYENKQKLKNINELSKIIPILLEQNTNGEKSIVVSSTQLLFVLKCLKSHISYQYKMLTSISGVDFLGKDYRFSVVYDLLSLTFNARLRLKVFVNEITPVNSIVSIFKNASWWEREIWDMYGISFSKHPDLRRILTDYGFEGHPMRKDFPITGYVEFKYDESRKRVIGEPIELTQEFRTFTFEMPY